MFIANLYRRNELQDTVEIMVLDRKDELFLKRNNIAVDLDDRTFEVVLVARNAAGRTVEMSKGTLSIREAFSALVHLCSRSLITQH